MNELIGECIVLLSTPKPVVDLSAKVVKKALGNEQVRATLARNGMDFVVDSTPEPFAAFMKADLQNSTRIAKESNINVK